MKTIKSIFAISLTFLFMTTSINVFSQKTNVWKGGTPGQETNWDCPKNWSTFSVPDAFTDVFIPDVSTTSLSNPVIRYGSFEVNSLFLESDAYLTISTEARLLVYDRTTGINKFNLDQQGPMLMIEEEGDFDQTVPVTASFEKSQSSQLMIHTH